MTPWQRYQRDLMLGGISPDAEQALAMGYLQAIYEKVLAVNDPSIFKRLFARASALKYSKKPIKGLYLWGGVGIGKTYLMDIFYESLPTEYKLRMHFHRFMQQIHEKLRLLQGKSNPLQLIAKELAQHIRVICFDEFLVKDIVDAMLLANLFQALFAQGIILIATSNTQPDNLYYNGLQRGLFLPAIELVKQHCDILHLQTSHDYRLRNLEQVGVYFYPLDAEAAENIRDAYESFARGGSAYKQDLTINQRLIKTQRYTDEVLWVDFADICGVPRSQHDYLEIANKFSTVLISNVPKIHADQDNIITYLINLVDVFYDQHVKLIISAEKPAEKLYTAGRLLKDFQRTCSRLLEMQSQEYLSLPHIKTIT